MKFFIPFLLALSSLTANADQYIRYPSTNGNTPTYANFASLPSLAADGTTAITLDTHSFWIFNLGTMTWVLQAASSGVTGPGVSVDSQVALFSGTGGNVIKAATVTGVAHLTSGVLTASNVVLTSEVSGVLPIGNGGTNSGTMLNNGRIIQSTGGAIVEAPAITPNRALASDAGGIPVDTATSATQLSYLSTTTSDVQTQLNGKQATGSYITALTGDVSASGPGSATATVNSVGGSTAANINTATIAANAATSANTASTIVKRDGSGDFSAGTITAALIGNATTATTATTAGNVSGVVAIANGGTGQTSASAAFDALSPLTTKGDLLSYSTVDGRVGVGTNGQVLTADSTQTFGLKWATPSSGFANPMTTQGDMIYEDGVPAPNRLPKGTAVQVLHSGNTPSWSAVSLTADVSGVLPTANGGTGQNSTATFPTSGVVVTEAGIETLTNKTINGASNTLTVRLASDVTGALPIANGGTGQTTANAAFNALSPMNTAGDLIYGGASGAGTRLAAGTSGNLLVSAGAAAPTWSNTVSLATTFSGGVVFGNGGTNLNWYEEGTFTPTIASTGTAGTVTYAVQVASFTRIGREVFIEVYVSWTNWTGSPTGNMNIAGLPYASSSTTNSFVTFAMQTNSITFPASETMIIGRMTPGNSTVDLIGGGSGIAAASVAAASNAGATSRYVMISGHYHI